jgi:hypothetical protein
MKRKWSAFKEEKMGTITVKVSDLTGEIIQPDEQIARIVVERHPDYEEEITLEIKPEDIEGKLPEEREGFVAISYYLHEEPEPRRFLLGREEFDNLFVNADSDKVLQHALATQEEEQRQRGKGRRRGGRRQGTERRERIDYASPEHAGEPHRGTVSEGEAEFIRNNLDAVNDRLRRDGYREINPSDPEMGARYRFAPPVGRDDAEAEGQMPRS